MEPSNKKGWTKFGWFICECGNKVERAIVEVKRDGIKSCGQCTIHGLSKTRFYKIWRSMKTRCLNPNYFEYRLYGGRGITINQHWHKFENFRDDMFDSYNEHVKKFGVLDTQIDRINGDGNYTPKNCRWATRKEQSNNRKGIIRVDYHGTKVTIPELSELTNIPVGTLYDRYYNDNSLLSKHKSGPKKVKEK